MPKRLFLILISIILISQLNISFAQDSLENISPSIFQKVLNEEFKNALTFERVINIECLEQNRFIVKVNTTFTLVLFILAVITVILGVNLYKTKTLTKKYLDKVGVMVLMLDRRARVKMINRYGANFLGYAQDELEGKNIIGMTVPEEYRDELTDKFSKVVRGMKDVDKTMNVELITKSGQRKKVKWFNFAVVENLRIKYVISTGIDVTEETEQREELEKKTIQLEKLNEAMIDRELKMAQMKARIKELEER